MLSHLSIKNLALIDELTISFDSGLNILTGETGAGKSIIIDAISLVLGERADRDLIRTGEEFARVEAVFYVKNNNNISNILDLYGIQKEDDGSLVLVRELSTTGRNTCRINGRSVTVSMLKELGQYLVDIHGQHQHQSLLSVESHRQLLDSLGDNSLKECREKVYTYYTNWKNIKNEIEKLFGVDKEGERKKDILQYQLNEIDEAHLKEKEDEELLHERSLLQNAEKISAIINEAYNVLYTGEHSNPSISDRLAIICESVSDISGLDEQLTYIKTQLDNIYYQIEDVVINIRDYKDAFYYDPLQLEKIEARLDTIRTLKRKYGDSITEILDFKNKIQAELKLLENSQEHLAILKDQLKQAYSTLITTCGELSQKRLQLAKSFEVRMHKELSQLGMEKARFKVAIDSPPCDANLEKYITSQGYDKIEFLISPNAGEPLKPLSKIVSGGEMSRIMLAFKNILANTDDIPVLIFDEIDVGISGRIAQVVAQKMATISRSHQLLCVTHLPQIAAMGDHQYIVEKVSNSNRTLTKAHKLDIIERQRELAKMIDGSKLSKLGLDHASELINQANLFKKKMKINL